MKVGTHAQESLDRIIARKRKEIEDAGFAFWGYGGNTCHPQTMVQPFVKDYERRGGTIYLCMEEMDSNHLASQIAADDYSADGVVWTPIPRGITVLGSRYALAIKDLRPSEFELPLNNTRVAIGNSRGTIGAKYIAGRVDKACLEVTELPARAPENATAKKIGLVARIVDPYAVYLRNRS
jgi:hypothetical protein